MGSAAQIDLPWCPLEQHSLFFQYRCANRYSLRRLPLDHI
jgi:hypothetical protein